MTNQRGILWLAFEDQTPPIEAAYSNFPNHFHVTLAFGVNSADFQDFIGRNVPVRFDYGCWDGQIQAAQVTIMDSAVAALCTNAVPHVTVSMQEGVSPVASNQMLSREHESSPLGGFIMYTTVEFFAFGS
jgi:hypothetical protein